METVELNILEFSELMTVGINYIEQHFLNGEKIITIIDYTCDKDTGCCFIVCYTNNCIFSITKQTEQLSF